MLGFVLGALAAAGVQFAWHFYQNQLEDSSHRSGGRRSNDTTTAAATASTTATSAAATQKSSYDVVAGVSQSGFLTELVGQLWHYINLAGCKIVKDTVEPMFAKDLPTPLNTLHFSKLDLGTVPLRLDNIVVHQLDLAAKTVQFELDVIWDGECNIELKADYIGSLGVRHVKLMGRMSVLLMPLLDAVPIIQAVQYSFINPPTLDLDFTGLAQIADVKLIDTSVRNVIQNVLQGMVVLPNRMTTKLDSTVKFYDIYKPPLGIARLTAISGKGFTVEKRTIGKDDIRDVYLKLTVGTTSWTTSVQNNTLEPIWNETSDVVLYDYDQIIYIQAWDSDDGTLDKDDILGYGQVTVGELLLATGRTRTVTLLDKEDTSTGATVKLSAAICQLTSKSLASLDEQKTAITESKLLYGAVSIIIANVTNVPLPNDNEALCSIKVEYGTGSGTEVIKFETSPVLGLNPTYDVAYIVPITSKTVVPSDLTFTLLSNPTPEQKKKNKAAESSVLGSFTLTHQDLLNAPNYQITEARGIGNGATVDYQVKLCGLEIPIPVTTTTAQAVTSTSTAAAAIEPNSAGGITDVTANENQAVDNAVEIDDSKMSVNLTIKSGRGFQEQKRRMRIRKDVPDVYVKVQFGPLTEPWKTATIDNSINPVWANETKRYDLVHYGMMIVFDVYDSDGGNGTKLSDKLKLDTKDDMIGTARISVGKLLLAGGGTVELELLDKSGTQGTGAYITVSCEKVLQG